VNHVAWWLWVGLVPAALLLRLWLATLRIRYVPEQIAVWRAQSGKGRLFLLWHNRLVLTPELKRRFIPDNSVNGLVSASKDGAWLTAFFKLLGILSIRGSSSWRGGPAMLEILRRLNNGEDVGITPDGPRGPCYDWKRGAVKLALKTEHPFFLVGMRFHKAARLRSWDRFYIPFPFSRVDLRLDPVLLDDPVRALPEEEFSEQIHQRLAALTLDYDCSVTFP
jgi:lysophospholipid acyltransferase (LPLAT)-like uncharacterized protein